MTYLVMLAALALLPVLAILFLRVNGAVAFMSLCLGSVLVTYVSGDVNDIVSSFAAKGSTSVQRQIQHQAVWHQLDSLQTAVILGGAAFSLLFLLFTHRSSGGDEEGKKHKG
jgi:hypothetical protein